MIEFAKYVGLIIFALVFLAVPVLLALSIIFYWSVFLIIPLMTFVVCEVALIIFAIVELADEGIL